MMALDRHSHGPVPTRPRTGCTGADCAAARNPYFVLPVSTLAVLPRVLAAVEHLPIATDSASRRATAGAVRRGRAPGSGSPDLEECARLGRPGSRGVHPARPARTWKGAPGPSGPNLT